MKTKFIYCIFVVLCITTYFISCKTGASSPTAGVEGAIADSAEAVATVPDVLHPSTPAMSNGLTTGSADTATFPPPPVFSDDDEVDNSTTSPENMSADAAAAASGQNPAVPAKNPVNSRAENNSKVWNTKTHSQPPAVELQNIDVKKMLFEGKAAVYVPKIMYKDQDVQIVAILTRKELETQLIKNMIAEASTSNGIALTQKDIKNIETQSIKMLNKMKVFIDYDRSVFEIISADQNPVKEFNDEKQLKWKWLIKPTQTASRKHIKFYFSPVDSNDNITFEQSKVVQIDVHYRDVISKYLGYLASDPQYTVPAILLPLCTLAYNRYRKRGRKSVKEESGS